MKDGVRFGNIHCHTQRCQQRYINLLASQSTAYQIGAYPTTANTLLGLIVFSGKFSPLSALTDLRHCYLSACGYHSKGIYDAHKQTQAPILRTGPNALSFGDVRAIHDIYGHGTRCTKDVNYSILGGSHMQLFDVVDKTHNSPK